MRHFFPRQAAQHFPVAPTRKILPAIPHPVPVQPHPHNLFYCLGYLTGWALILTPFVAIACTRFARCRSRGVFSLVPFGIPAAVSRMLQDLIGTLLEQDACPCNTYCGGFFSSFAGSGLFSGFGAR